jgi:hypothetical protein
MVTPEFTFLISLLLKFAFETRSFSLAPGQKESNQSTILCLA